MTPAVARASKRKHEAKTEKETKFEAPPTSTNKLGSDVAGNTSHVASKRAKRAKVATAGELPVRLRSQTSSYWVPVQNPLSTSETSQLSQGHVSPPFGFQMVCGYPSPGEISSFHSSEMRDEYAPLWAAIEEVKNMWGEKWGTSWIEDKAFASRHNKRHCREILPDEKNIEVLDSLANRRRRAIRVH